MKLDTTFFKWFKFFIAIFKLFIQNFGDQEEVTELKKNGFE